MKIHIQDKMFKDILREYQDIYEYVALLSNVKRLHRIESYLEDGVCRGYGYFTVENQGVEEGNEEPIIYKFIDRFEGSKRIARLLTQEEYERFILEINESAIIEKLKDGG